jgi:hypothetical protein
MTDFLRSLPLVLLMLCCMTGRSDSETAFDYFSVSAPQISLSKWESIYAFTVDTKGAVILRTRVPLQWDLAIDNSDGGRSHLKATAIVGASALDVLRYQYFKDFLQIGKLKPPEIHFEVELSLTITDDKSGKMREVVLPTDKMTLTPCSEP